MAEQADRYRLDLLDLVAAFEFEFCEECGKDINYHIISPGLFGPHLWCEGTAALAYAPKCSDCGGTGSVPAAGGEAPEDVDNGYVRCPTCGPIHDVNQKGGDSAQE